MWSCAKAQCQSIQIIGGTEALNRLQLDCNPPTIVIRLRMGVYVSPSNKAMQHCCHWPQCCHRSPPSHHQIGMINPSFVLPSCQPIINSAIAPKHNIASIFNITFDIDIMRKRTSFHLLFISQSCTSAQAILFLYCLIRNSNGDSTRAATTTCVMSSPSCAGAQASFRTVCCCLTTTTHNYVGNKPLCASTLALYFGNNGKEC